MVLIREDLPQPFGPSTATCSSTWTRRLKSSRTIFSPRITRTFCRSSNGAWRCTLSSNSTLQYRKDSRCAADRCLLCRFAAVLNSLDFHKIATFLQSLAAILIAVALLTGRVYQDGLGGLRAVLFHSCNFLRQQSLPFYFLYPEKLRQKMGPHLRARNRVWIWFCSSRVIAITAKRDRKRGRASPQPASLEP